MAKMTKYWVRKESGTFAERITRKMNLYKRAGLKNPSRFKKPIYKCDISRLIKENSRLTV